MAEASVSRTHRRQETCRPPVLKTGRITGPHALPYLRFSRPRVRNPDLKPLVRTVLGRRAARTRMLVLGFAATSFFKFFPSYLGCATIRRYGFRVFQPPGNFCFACSSETAGGMITSFPGFQFTGVATLCFAVS